MAASNIFDQVFDAVCHPILSFLPVRDAIRCYLLLNKRAVANVTKHYLCKYHTTDSVDDGVINNDDGPELLNIIYNFMRIVIRLVIFPVSEKSKKALEGQPEPGMFCKFGDDLHTIMAQVFTQWFAVPSNIDKGVLRLFYDGALSRAQECREEDDNEKFTYTMELLEDDVQYWYHSRVFDSFIILFERSDGTILVSEDLKRVYLVVDIDIRISYKCIYYMTKDLKAIQNRAKTVQKCLPFGPIYGQKVSILLLPFQNMIITDGAIFHREPLTPAHIKAAVGAYLTALDNNSLITKLPKSKPTLNYKAPSVESDYIALHKRENSAGLQYLRSVPQRKRCMWWFSSDQEKVNGVDIYSIQLRAEGNSVFDLDGSRKDVPKEYIDALCTACRTFGYRPDILFMPMIDVFVVMLELLGDDLFTMQFQADPCPEDLFYCCVEDKLKCQVCKCSTTPTGKKVMKCTRCNNAYYCCQEHQREDWPSHKRNCKK